jgi:LmbE family N-acetylglucosaminyl deacetylase
MRVRVSPGTFSTPGRYTDRVFNWYGTTMAAEKTDFPISKVIPSREYVPAGAMVVHAHPDDQEFSTAGTIARWSKAGCQVISVIITSGEAGSNFKDKDEKYKPELAKIRETEQNAANTILGIAETVFLHYPDGLLQPSLELRRELTRLIRNYKPEIVITGDPTVRFYGDEYMNHPDHRVAADVCCDAVFPSAGTRLIFPELLTEGCEPHDVSYLYMHGSEKNNLYIDISETLDLKIKALQQHKSQISESDAKQIATQWAIETGELGGVKYAESYHVMVLK